MNTTRFLSLKCLIQQPNTRLSSSFTHLASELTARRLPLIYDYLIPTPSHLLNLALSDILPPSSTASITAPPPPFPTTTPPAPLLPPTHHLIYFPPAIPGRLLLSDGTDPLQSPGDPFVRRMWAGGALRFDNRAHAPLALDGSCAICLESIKNVSIKGAPGTEKVFVGIERRVGVTLSEDEPEESIRKRLYRDAEDDFADGAVGAIERRNIVFLRSRTREQAAAEMQLARTKQLAPPTRTPDIDVTVAPDAKLLFRYSALTYNAHAIHLDSAWCKEEEGHRGLLVHGPLSFTLLVTALRLRLAGEGRGEVASSVEYRNLAPLYVGEPLRICGRAVKRAEKGEAGKWEIWAETPEGGVAVKGIVRTEVVDGKPGVFGDLDMILGRP